MEQAIEEGLLPPHDALELTSGLVLLRHLLFVSGLAALMVKILDHRARLGWWKGHHGCKGPGAHTGSVLMGFLDLNHVAYSVHAMHMHYGGLIRGCAALWLCAYLVPFLDLLPGVPCMVVCLSRYLDTFYDVQF